MVPEVIEPLVSNLPKLKALYTFNPILKNYDVDSNTALLSKQKGNVLKDLKLMTYNISENQAKKDIGSQPLRKSKSIFISYNHLDETYKDEVIKTLNGLSYLFPELKFDIWSDDRIKTGQRWKEEIEQALELAGIAILIMSRNFLGSEFIMTNELPIILDNANKKGTIIMNLIAGKCLTNELISQYQCVNDPNEPLKKLTPHEQDVVYVRLADDVKRHLST
ncbi:MAG: TIR domain-containing protein [Flavobacterium sp.]|nr:MAG: TIR domain-containing protein [Flavobacterium sp.]